MPNPNALEIDDIERLVQERYDALVAIVEKARRDLEEAETALASFRSRMVAKIGVTTAGKSAQKQRADRQRVVKALLDEGLSRAEIVRRTGIIDHLVGYDIDCIRKGRRPKGTKVYADGRAPESGSESAEPAAREPVDVDEEDPEVDEIESEEEDSSEAVTPEKTEEVGASKEALLAEVTRQQNGIRGKVVILGTTTTKNHRHTIRVDRMGDGQTVVDGSGHVHRCERFVLSAAHGHVHQATVRASSSDE